MSRGECSSKDQGQLTHPNWRKPRGRALKPALDALEDRALLSYQPSLTTILSVAPTRIPPPVAHPAVTWSIVFVWTNRNQQVGDVEVLFSGALRSAQASKVGLYRLSFPDRRGSFNAPNAKVIPLRSAQYEAASDSVTLTPRKPFDLTKVFQLRIDGRTGSGLEDASGLLIDGNNNGRPGGNVKVVLWHPGVTFSEAEYQQEMQRTGTFDS
jgi:hypothetical protein